MNFRCRKTYIASRGKTSQARFANTWVIRKRPANTGVNTDGVTGRAGAQFRGTLPRNFGGKGPSGPTGDFVATPRHYMWGPTGALSRGESRLTRISWLCDE